MNLLFLFGPWGLGFFLIVCLLVEAIADVLGLAYCKNSIRLLKRGLTNSGSVDRLDQNHYKKKSPVERPIADLSVMY